jgi:transcriptional regulator with XRE-family HTH domain
MSKPVKPKAEEVDLEFAARIAKAFKIGKITGSIRSKAEQLGVSKTFVDDLQKGRAMPSARNLRDIAIRCGVNSDWLLTGNGEAQDVIASGKLDISDLTIQQQAALYEIVKSMKEKKD